MTATRFRVAHPLCGPSLPVRFLLPVVDWRCTPAEVLKRPLRVQIALECGMETTLHGGARRTRRRRWKTVAAWRGDTQALGLCC
jgi:hypothetical protein